MKRNISFALRLIALIFVLALTLCGCAANGTVDENAVVAKVGDTQITMADYAELYDQMYQQMAGSYDLKDESSLANFRTYVLRQLVEEELLYQKSIEAGAVLSEADITFIADYVADARQTLVSTYEDLATQQGAADAVQKGAELLNEGLTDAGYGSLEEYLAALEKSVSRYLTVENFKVIFAKDITASDEEIRAQYNTDVEAQKAEYDADASAYEAAQTSYDVYGGFPPVYVPGEYRRVRHILVSELDVANQLYQQLQDGGDFDALMTEYGTDPGMKSEPNMSLGYLMYEKTSFVPEFLEAALALKNVGDFSKPVQSMHGYHIIRLERIYQAGAAVFEDVVESYRAAIIKDKSDAALEEAMESWFAEGNVQSFNTLIENYTPSENAA